MGSSSNFLSVVPDSKLDTAHYYSSCKNRKPTFASKASERKLHKLNYLGVRARRSRRWDTIHFDEKKKHWNTIFINYSSEL